AASFAITWESSANVARLGHVPRHPGPARWPRFNYGIVRRKSLQLAFIDDASRLTLTSGMQQLSVDEEWRGHLLPASRRSCPVLVAQHRPAPRVTAPVATSSRSSCGARRSR